MTKIKLITTLSILGIIGISAISSLILNNNAKNNITAKANNSEISIEQKCYLKESNQSCPTTKDNQANYIQPDQEFIYQIRLINNTNNILQNLEIQIVNDKNVNLTMINDLSNKRNLEQNQKAEYYLKGNLTESAKQNIITGETIFVQNIINIATKTNIISNTNLQLVSNNKNNSDQISVSPTTLATSATQSSQINSSISSTINTGNNSVTTSKIAETSNSETKISINSSSQQPNSLSNSQITSANPSNSSTATNSSSNIAPFKVLVTCVNAESLNQLCTNIKNDAKLTYKIQVTNISTQNLTNSKVYIRHNIEQQILESNNSSSVSNFSVKSNDSDKELEIPLIKSNETLTITFDSLLKITTLKDTPIVSIVVITNPAQTVPNITTYKIPKIVVSQATTTSSSNFNVITDRATIINLNTDNKSLQSSSITESVKSSLNTPSTPLATSTTTSKKNDITIRTGGQENLTILSSSLGFIGILALFIKKQSKKLL